jgi:anti-sigma regulatory factor (Ser/Thr protein kinase)
VNEFRLRVTAEARRLVEVRQAMRTWLSLHSVCQPDDVVLAVDEAVANAIEHAGYGRPEPAFIDVVARKEGESIRVEVTDRGYWRPRQSDDTRGRGLKIIQAVMDDVQVDTTSSGTCVVMQRRVER